MTLEIAPLDAARRELAHRVLARRRLLTFTQKINPRYLPGWVHEDICRRLERFSREVEEGKSPRLMLLMPPRHGKSELASRMFPAWHLGRCPDHEFIACSYNVSLAMSFSRKVKEVIQDPVYEAIFDTRLHPDFQAAEEWAIKGHRGSYVAAGVSGGITGKGCFSLDTAVRTRDNLASFRDLQVGDHVLAYNHRTGQAELTPILALHAQRHAAGTGVYCGVRCTADHPIYSPATQRYHPAADHERAGLPVLRWTEVEEQQGVSGVQLTQTPAHWVYGLPEVWWGQGAPRPALRWLPRLGALGAGRADVRGVRGDVPPASRGCGEGAASLRPHLLLTRVLRGVQTAAGSVTRRMQTLWGRAARTGAESVLLQGLLQLVPLARDLGWRVWGCVPAAEAAGAGAGWQHLRHDGGRASPGGAPHRPQPGQQRDGEPDYVVEGGARAISRTPGCTAGALATRVERTGEEPHVVVDLQTRFGNFFADGVLVHNCHVLTIDDPVKNAEEANSADLREKLWEWYTSTAYTRLAPGGGVLVIQTCWHDDDLAGKLQNAMRTDDEADRFEVIKYPAIAEFDEYLDPETDLIVDAPPEGRPDLVPLRLKGEALHPARYDLRRLNQIKRTLPTQWWSALYQQNPVPDEGVYFTKDMFRRGPAPRASECYVSIAFDFAISEKQQNDFTVGTATLLDSDDVLHFVDRVRFKSADADFICKAIVSLCKKWHNPSIQLGLEDGQIYRAISGPLKREMARQRVYPSMQLLKPITDKQARARTLQGRMQQGLVSFSDEAEWYDSMRTEMLRFPSGVNDDQVDSAAWNAIMVAGRQPPKKQQARPMKSWKDRLQGVGDGTHMAA